MKIHINQIPVGGLHIEGEEDREILEIADEKTDVVSRVRYSLDVGLSEGGLFATGNLEVDVRLECVCCLERFDYLLAVPDFAVQVELTTSELVDLTEEIREDILLTLPPYPHCDRDGALTCSGVRNIPQIKEEITEEPANGSAQGDLRKNPWISLDKFKPND
jgi:uncharacterized protein